MEYKDECYIATYSLFSALLDVLEKAPKNMARPLMLSIYCDHNITINVEGTEVFDGQLDYWVYTYDEKDAVFTRVKYGEFKYNNSPVDMYNLAREDIKNILRRCD